MNDVDLDLWFGGNLGGLTISEARAAAALADDLSYSLEWADALVEALERLELTAKYDDKG